MKRHSLSKLATLCAISIVFWMASESGLAQTLEEKSPTQQPAPYIAQTIPFKIIILGTRYHADISTIEKNLGTIPAVKSLTPTLSSQNRLEYLGSYLGAPETLTADIQTLAADRFEMESRTDKEGRITFTLRKMSSPPTQQF